MRIIAIMLLAAALYGCAGSSFSFDQARQVQLGMTEAEVVSILGKPYSVVARGDEQMWVWSHANSLSGAVRSVSFKMKDGKVIELPTIPNTF